MSTSISVPTAAAPGTADTSCSIEAPANAASISCSKSGGNGCRRDGGVTFVRFPSGTSTPSSKGSPVPSSSRSRRGRGPPPRFRKPPDRGGPERSSARPVRRLLDYPAQRRLCRTLGGRLVGLGRICVGRRRGCGVRRQRRCPSHRLVRDRGGRRGGRGRNRQRVGRRWIGIDVHRETEVSRERRTRVCTLAFSASKVYHAQGSKGRDPRDGHASSFRQNDDESKL